MKQQTFVGWVLVISLVFFSSGCAYFLCNDRDCKGIIGYDCCTKAHPPLEEMWWVVKIPIKIIATPLMIPFTIFVMQPLSQLGGQELSVWESIVGLWHW